MTEPMRTYSVYGHCLASRLPLSELEMATADQSPHWRFEPVESLETMRSASMIGEDEIYQGVHARLHAHAAGHRITIEDTGDFDLSRDGVLIRWSRREPAWPDFVRSHLLGRVLATRIHLDGGLPLHASAVETRAGVIGFLAPKGFGKSTLALALVSAGARLVTDDTLPVDPGPTPMAWPGVHAVRAHRDAIDAVGMSVPAADGVEGKHLLREIPRDRRTEVARPLAALYLIDPVDPVETRARRTEVPPMLAAIGVIAHVKIGKMLGAAAAAPMLERAAAIATGAPVYRLHAPRDLALLAGVAKTVLGWHGGAPA